MRRVRPPAPARGCPIRDAPPSGLRSPGVPAPDALRFPRPDGIGAPRGARLPCDRAGAASAACERTPSSTLLAGWIQDQGHRAGERLPFRVLGKELFPAERREAI